MDLDRTNEIVGLALGLLALMGAVAGWLKVIRPRYRAARRKAIAISDALIGREAITDTITGRELAPALPGIGARMETVEKAVTHVADLLTTQRDQDREIETLKERVTEAHKRIDNLEAQTIERVATKAESVAAWKAVAAVANQPDPMDDRAELE